MSRDNRTAIVTGAGRGLGRAIALRLARSGAGVAVLDLDPVTAEETAALIRDLGREATWVGVDISDDVAVASAIETCASTLGRVDTLVNNAGIVHTPSAFQDIPAETVTRILSVNVEGTLNVSRHALPHLRKTKGSVVRIASNAALRPRPFAAVYNASKGAIVNLTYSMAAELAPNVRVNAVAPSIAQTDMLDFPVGDDPKGARCATIWFPRCRWAGLRRARTSRPQSSSSPRMTLRSSRASSFRWTAVAWSDESSAHMTTTLCLRVRPSRDPTRLSSRRREGKDHGSGSELPDRSSEGYSLLSRLLALESSLATIRSSGRRSRKRRDNWRE